MPDPKNNAKLTGDTHLPDIDDDAGPDAADLEDEARPGRGENQAGFVKDKDLFGDGKGKAS